MMNLTFKEYLEITNERNGYLEKEEFYNRDYVIKALQKDDVFEIAWNAFSELRNSDSELQKEIQGSLKGNLRFPRRKEIEKILKDNDNDFEYVIEYVYNYDRGFEFLKDLFLNHKRKTFSKSYDMFWREMYSDRVYKDIKDEV